MPAKIVVVTGDNAGEEHWIEDAVVRVGRNPACEICLDTAGVPDHALTLEFDSGQDRYTVYNRSTQEVTLGGYLLPPNGSAPWSANDELEFEGLVLRLDIEGTATPVRQVPAGPSLEDFEPEPTTQSGVETAGRGPTSSGRMGGSKTVIQLLVTLGFVIASLALIVFGLATQQDSADTAAPILSYRELVEEMGASRNPDAGDLRALRSLLQAATMAELRGDTTQARESYGLIRDRLLSRQDEDGKMPDVPVYQHLLDYVKLKLSRMALSTKVKTDGL